MRQRAHRPSGITNGQQLDHTLDTWPWNSTISLPSMLPNLLTTSLCHASYFRPTLAWTYRRKAMHNADKFYAEQRNATESGQTESVQ